MISIAIYAFMFSLVINIAIIYISHKYTFFIDSSTSDKPQNFHLDETPRAGGIGIFAGMLLLLTIPFGTKLMFSILLSFLSGIFEDFHNSLSPQFRLILQFIAAMAAIFLSNAVITYIGLGITLPYAVGVIFSAVAIVGMMNAVNFIDGFNGLAGGMILLILASLGYTSYQNNNVEILYIISIIFSSVIGFMVLNFPKGKIFLGDGGAYLLGFTVAIIGIFMVSKYDGVSPWYILAIFIYPVWEVLFSIVRKILADKSPLQPDRHHLHMLVYRKLTNNNPMTSIVIVGSVLPFILISTLYPYNSIANMLISGLFIVCYQLVYEHLRGKKDI